jgi:HAD superfamily hydrolase (TIGR01509 family)
MKAIVFDMDGVVLDSEGHWDVEEFSLFQKLVPGWNRKQHKKVVGLNIHDTFVILKGEGMRLDEASFAEQINAVAMNLYRNKAKVMAGFEDLAKGIKARRIPIGLVSSSRHTWIEFALKKNELENYFDYVTSSQEIKGPGKPAPDIYLLAAKKMGISPKDSIAVEDSANGVRAAKSAGFFTIGFRFGGNDDQDHSVADMDLRGFTKANNQKILSLLNKRS